MSRGNAHYRILEKKLLFSTTLLFNEKPIRVVVQRHHYLFFSTFDLSIIFGSDLFSIPELDVYKEVGGEYVQYVRIEAACLELNEHPLHDEFVAWCNDFAIPRVGNLISGKVTMVLKRQWYDMTVSGEKTIEYREISKHWNVRLWEKRHHLRRVTFLRGMTPIGVSFKIKEIDKGPCPLEGFDKGEYYRIHF